MTTSTCLRTVILLCTVASTWGAAEQGDRGSIKAETYQSATVDSEGRLAITNTDGRRVIVRKVPEQTSFSDPMLSPAKTAVAAQAMFGNCCTSYDIPLQLVVYASGRVHRFKGTGLPIFEWGFADEGARIAYGQEPVHFGCFIHYELREIASERLIEAVDVPEPCGQMPNPQPVRVPDWVAALRSKK